MNINNPTTFATPSLTYSTSNSSGTAGALRADDTIAVFDAPVPGTITPAASAATGSAAIAARRDHVHGATTIGNVVGPGSSVDNTLVRYSGASGLLIQGYTSGGPTVSDTGVMLQSAQPCFRYYLASDDTGVTGDGTVYTCIFDTETFARGSGWDGTSTFTATATGIYLFLGSLEIGGGTAGGWNAGTIDMIMTAGTTRKTFRQPGSQADIGNIDFGTIAPMTADDTLQVQLTISGEASDNINVNGVATRTWFAAYLLA